MIHKRSADFLFLFRIALSIDYLYHVLPKLCFRAGEYQASYTIAVTLLTKLAISIILLGN